VVRWDLVGWEDPDWASDKPIAEGW
jgi:hypothetical protein